MFHQFLLDQTKNVPEHLVMAVAQNSLGALASLALQNYRTKLITVNLDSGQVTRPEVITWEVVMDWLLDLLGQRNKAPESETISQDGDLSVAAV